MQNLQFIQKIAPNVRAVCKGTGLFPSVMIAQACLESSYGMSKLSVDAYNYFGMKTGSSWKGKVVTMQTAEYVAGKRIVVPQPFRAYDNLEDNFQDHVDMLKRVGVYKTAGVFTSKTYKDQCAALLKAGYATDPMYASKLEAIIILYQLTQYDNI